MRVRITEHDPSSFMKCCGCGARTVSLYRIEGAQMADAVWLCGECMVELTDKLLDGGFGSQATQEKHEQ